MKKDITILEIEAIKKSAQGLIAEIILSYEKKCPMVVESIEILENKDTGKTEIIFLDYFLSDKKTYIKPSEKDL